MTVLASPPAPRSISTSTKRSCGGKGALSCCACAERGRSRGRANGRGWAGRGAASRLPQVRRERRLARGGEAEGA